MGACVGPQLAISGGEREILYELNHRAAESGWDLRAKFSAKGFTEYLVASAPMDGPLPCSAESLLERGCTIRLMLDGNAPFGVRANVVGITNRVSVLDVDGQLVDLAALGSLDQLDVAADGSDNTPEVIDDSWWSYVPGWSLIGGTIEVERQAAPSSPATNPDSPTEALQEENLG